MSTTLPVDNAWGLAAALGTILITSYFGYLTIKVKSTSDKKDEDVKPVLEKVEQTAHLQPVVDELVRQMAIVQAELAQHRPIAKVKYPLALNTIASFRQAHPSSTVFIPHQIQEDL